MTITVLCPRGHTVVLDAWPRRAIACPRCGVVFTTHEGPDPVPSALPGGMAARSERRPRRDEDEEEEDDDRPRRRKRRDDDDEDDGGVRKGPAPKRKPVPRRRDEEDEDEDEEESVGPVLTKKQRQLTMVRLGILFHIIKLWVYIASFLFGFISLPLLVFLAIFMSGIIGSLLLQLTYNLAMTIAPLLGIVGSVLCTWAPVRSEARGTIIVSMIFDGLAPFFGILQIILWFGFAGSADERIGRLVEYMFLARLASTLTAWWLFQLYLRKVAFYIRETLLASECLNVIVHFLMATVITPTLVVALFIVIVFIPMPCITLILFFALVGWTIYLAITFPIRQFRLLFNMRNRIYVKFLKPDDDD